ncbi:MAG: sugar ABC transporter substrate-binding protein [Solirubrobacteraceae bacterium]|nr:sugar ABC transporter substrate-binding protein [Solirubrobacteraceae bacterium]
MRLRMIGAVALAAASVLAAGCGSDDGDGESASTSASDEKYSIGIVGFSAADQTSEQAIAGIKATAKEKGYEVTSVDPQGSTDKAVAAMQDLVQKNVDMLVVTVFPSDAMTAGVRAAKAAGIPVVSLSGGTADGVQVNYDAGEPQGKMVADQLVKDTGGKGKLLALGYKSGLPCIGREKALDAAIGATEIQQTRNEVPIPGQVEASTQFTQAWLAKNPDVGDGLAVWGCFDDPALGAIAAIKQGNREGVKVYGVNGQPGAVKAIQDGDMDGTVYLKVFEAGQQIAENTGKVVEAGVDAEPEDVPIPSDLITPENVDAFVEENPDALKGL